jgi:hypothetical protein
LRQPFEAHAVVDDHGGHHVGRVDVGSVDHDVDSYDHHVPLDHDLDRVDDHRSDYDQHADHDDLYYLDYDHHADHDDFHHLDDDQHADHDDLNYLDYDIHPHNHDIHDVDVDFDFEHDDDQRPSDHGQLRGGDSASKHDLYDRPDPGRLYIRREHLDRCRPAQLRLEFR